MENHHTGCETEFEYCDMCGKKFPLVKLLWMDIDEFGPIYNCVPCWHEDVTELFTTDLTIEK